MVGLTKKNIRRLLDKVQTLVKNGGISGLIASLRAAKSSAMSKLIPANLNRSTGESDTVYVAENSLRPGYYSRIHPITKSIFTEVEYKGRKPNFKIVGKWYLNLHKIPFVKENA